MPPVIIYLFLALLPESSELLLTDYQYVFLTLCFVLAPSKDLAVSFLYFYKTYPDGYRNLSVLALLFAPRMLPCAAVSRYFFNLLAESGSSDFPLSLMRQQSLTLLIHLNNSTNKALRQSFIKFAL